MAVITVVTFLMLPALVFANPTAPPGGTSATPAMAFVQTPQPSEVSAPALALTAEALATNSDLAPAASDEGVLLDATSISSASAELPDEKPPGAKVPEPASLMLVGSGLLAIARASRMRRPRWTATRAAPVVMECAVSRKILARQAA